MAEDDRRGVLFPQRLPEFHRISPAPEIAHAVRWFWIPSWDLPAGTSSRQEILPFPACNIVVEPDGASVVGPPTTRSERVLEGRGWAVGALLRPAAVPALIPESAALRDAAKSLDEPRLHERVVRAMEAPALSGERRRGMAADAVSEWLRDRVPPIVDGSEAALANRLADALADPAVHRVDQLPGRLLVSTRTLQRIAARYFGLSLHSMIRRRRLQEGAALLRQDPSLGIAALADELGYSDHAHFTSDFKAVLGVTPSEYRKRSASEGH